MQAHQGKHSHSKQQSKRYKASGPATATCAPVPPQAPIVSGEVRAQEGEEAKNSQVALGMA